MKLNELIEFIKSKKFDDYLLNISSTREKEENRYLSLIEKMKNYYNDNDDYYFVSSPGRIEICGNHTDHQNGIVVACAINIDNVAIIKKTNDNICTFYDDNFYGKNNCIKVDISDLNMKESEKNTSQSLIRGIASILHSKNKNIGGFFAICDSHVLSGSGISSSACFENMIVEIFNKLYNDCSIDCKDRANISKKAENDFFCKPCGAMDQTAISFGSIIKIDFNPNTNEYIKQYSIDMKKLNYQLVLINTNSSHADLTDEYAAMPNEMRLVAKYFDKNNLIDIDENDFYNNLYDIRNNIKNDRAILRAIHFFDEMNRMKKLDSVLDHLQTDNNYIYDFLQIINESGNSSYKYLQNVYSNKNVNEQSLSIAISVCVKILKSLVGSASVRPYDYLELVRPYGAVRVHGGGLSGTILCFVPSDKINSFSANLTKIMKNFTIYTVDIRSVGTFSL